MKGDSFSLFFSLLYICVCVCVCVCICGSHVRWSFLSGFIRGDSFLRDSFLVAAVTSFITRRQQLFPRFGFLIAVPRFRTLLRWRGMRFFDGDFRKRIVLLRFFVLENSSKPLLGFTRQGFLSRGLSWFFFTTTAVPVKEILFTYIFFFFSFFFALGFFSSLIFRF